MGMGMVLLLNLSINTALKQNNTKCKYIGDGGGVHEDGIGSSNGDGDGDGVHRDGI